MLTRYLLREAEAESGNYSRLACATTHAFVAFVLCCHRKLPANISALQTFLVSATELKNQNF